jgi:hypothetical protein
MCGGPVRAGKDELVSLATEAYIFAYPLVTMELTRLQATCADPGQGPGRAPMNQFAHARTFPDADFRMVVRPNFDTLYSSAWLDLTAGPVRVSAPDVGDRYYLLPMLDMWTDVFATPGKRVSGTCAADWVVVPPGWDGPLPADADRIDAPTPYVWMIGRVQTNGQQDYDAVHKVQDGFQLSCLTGSRDAGSVPAAGRHLDLTTPPLDQVNAMPGVDFFTWAAELMKVHPAHPTDWSQVRRMRTVGLVPGQSFAASALERPVLDAVQAAPEAARAVLAAQLPTMATVINGWQLNTSSIGVYGTFYAKRAIIAMMGLGANPAEEAVYPILLADGSGDPLDGAHDYVLHFEKDELPPVSAFWSVTMYDEHGFQVANDLNRFAVGDRDPLVFNPDGSLDLYLRQSSPGPGREANWLPAPRGPLGVTMRLYGPDAAVLCGAWAPPPVHKERSAP